MSDIGLPSPVSSGPSDVELPADVEEGGEEGLPESFNGDAAAQHAAQANRHCSCRLQCRTRIPEEVVLEFRQKHLGLQEKDRPAAAFASIRSQIVDKDGNASLGYMKFTLGQHRVCRPFWEHAHAIGHGTFDKYKTMIRNGATELLAEKTTQATVGKGKTSILQG